MRWGGEQAVIGTAWAFYAVPQDIRLRSVDWSIHLAWMADSRAAR
jgi:hypothetical protein